MSEISPDPAASFPQSKTTVFAVFVIFLSATMHRSGARTEAARSAERGHFRWPGKGRRILSRQDDRRISVIPARGGGGSGRRAEGGLKRAENYYRDPSWRTALCGFVPACRTSDRAIISVTCRRILCRVIFSLPRGNNGGMGVEGSKAAALTPRSTIYLISPARFTLPSRV